MTRNLSKLSAKRTKKDVTYATEHRQNCRQSICIASETTHAHVSHAMIDTQNKKSNAKNWETFCWRIFLCAPCRRLGYFRIVHRRVSFVVLMSDKWTHLARVAVCTLPDSKRHWRLKLWTCEHRRRLIFSLNWGDVVGFTSHLWFKNSNNETEKKKPNNSHTIHAPTKKNEWWMAWLVQRQAIIYFKMHFGLWRGAPIILSRNCYMTRCLWNIIKMEKWKNGGTPYSAIKWMRRIWIIIEKKIFRLIFPSIIK